MTLDGTISIDRLHEVWSREDLGTGENRMSIKQVHWYRDQLETVAELVSNDVVTELDIPERPDIADWLTESKRETITAVLDHAKEDSDISEVYG